MSNKLTELTELITPASEDLIYTVDDPAGTPTSKRLTIANLTTYLAGVFASLTQTLTNKTISSASNTITITASNVSDFDTEVSNNTDVSANTSARHSAVTVSDSAEIDLTLTGQNITASLVAGSIDETKLDVSVNASLDLADSSLQASSIGTTVQGYDSALETIKNSTWTRGDIPVTNSLNELVDLAIGTNGQVLQSDGTDAAWATLTASDISDFDTEVANNTAVTANTAKVTNATHSGDASGDTTLTLNSTAISGKSANAGLAGTEEVLINNAGTLEKTTAQDIADLGGGGDPVWQATVGSTGADYTDIASAITAGHTRILLITSITDNNAITLPDGLYIRGLSGSEVWTNSSGTNGLTGTAGHEYTFENFGISLTGNNPSGFVNNLAYTLNLIDMLIDISNITSSRQFFATNGSALTLYMRGGEIVIDNRNGWYHQATTGEASYSGVKFTGTTSNSSFGLYGDNMKTTNLHVMGTWDGAIRGDLQGSHTNWRLESSCGFNLAEGVYTGFNRQGGSWNLSILDVNVQLVNWDATGTTITGTGRNGFKISGSNVGTVSVSGSDHNYSGTYFAGTLILSQDNATVSACTFNTTITVSGNYNAISACDFQGTVTLSGKGNVISASHFVNVPTITGAGNSIYNATSTSQRTRRINRRSERLLNNSGGALLVGDIVVIDNDANGDRFTTTTTAGDSKVYGMVEETINNGSTGFILVEGYTTALKVDGTADIAVGDYIMTFTSAGIGQLHTTGNTYIAQAFEAYTTDDSNGVINAFIGKGYA